MILPEMLADLPCTCDVVGTRDIRNHGAATSCISTQPMAAFHCCDSQVAIPLRPHSHQSVDLMDSAYDAPEIRAHSESLGHVAIIDANPRSASRKLERKTAARAQRAVGHVAGTGGTVGTVERVGLQGRVRGCGFTSQLMADFAASCLGTSRPFVSRADALTTYPAYNLLH